MVDVLIPVAESLEPGFWNDLYLGVFGRLEKTPNLRGANAKANSPAVVRVAINEPMTVSKKTSTNG